MDEELSGGSSDDQPIDWLWDLEDRYDLGVVDEIDPPHTSVAAEVPRVAAVKKRLRTQAGVDDDFEYDAALDAEHTGPMALFHDDEPGYNQPSSGFLRRFPRVAIAAAVLVVLGLGGAVFAATNHGSSHHPAGSDIAIQPPGWGGTTSSSVDTSTTLPATTDTTPTTTPTTLASGTTAGSVQSTPVDTTVPYVPPATRPPHTPVTTAPRTTTTPPTEVTITIPLTTVPSPTTAPPTVTTVQQTTTVPTLPTSSTTSPPTTAATTTTVPATTSTSM